MFAAIAGRSLESYARQQSIDDPNGQRPQGERYAVRYRFGQGSGRAWRPARHFQDMPASIVLHWLAFASRSHNARMPDFADHRDSEKGHLRGEMPCLRRWFNILRAIFRDGWYFDRCVCGSLNGGAPVQLLTDYSNAQFMPDASRTNAAQRGGSEKRR
jgi:hypothetical protein